MKRTTVLELAGVAALSAFAWAVWPPLSLLVLGLAALLASRQMARGGV